MSNTLDSPRVTRRKNCSGSKYRGVTGQAVWPYLQIRKLGYISQKCEQAVHVMRGKAPPCWRPKYVEISEIRTRLKCSALDNNAVLRISHYWSEFDPLQDWREKHSRLLLCCFVIHVVEPFFGFSVQQIQVFWVFANSKMENKDSY